MKVYLVRHGQTVENTKKIIMGQKHGKLTSVGVRQAQLLGKQFKNYKFDVIYSSDLKRATATLKEMRKYFPKVPVIYTKSIREIKLGELEGKKRNKVSMKDIHGNFMAKKVKGGESLQEVKKRINEFINELKRKHANDQVLIVTHTGPIKMFLSILQGVSIRKIFESIELENTSICKIETIPNKTKIFYINKIDHLNDEKASSVNKKKTI